MKLSIVNDYHASNPRDGEALVSGAEVKGPNSKPSLSQPPARKEHTPHRPREAPRYLRTHCDVGEGVE